MLNGYILIALTDMAINKIIANFLLLHPHPNNGRPEDYGLFFAIGTLLSEVSITTLLYSHVPLKEEAQQVEENEEDGEAGAWLES